MRIRRCVVMMLVFLICPALSDAELKNDYDGYKQTMSLYFDSLFVLVMCISFPCISSPHDFVKCISSKLGLSRKKLIARKLLLPGKYRAS